MTKSSKAAEELLNQRKIMFALNLQKSSKASDNKKADLMVTIGSDNERVFWNLQTHSSVYSDTLPSTPSCIKFSPDSLLITGYDNGTIDISTLKAEKEGKRLVSKAILNQRNSLKNSLSAAEQHPSPESTSTTIIYKSLQTFSEPSCKVLNIVFSEEGSFMAVSYLSKKDPEEGEERITGFVHVFGKSKNDLHRMSTKEPIYQKLTTITTAACTNLTPMGNYACYFMNFTSDEQHQHLILNFQQFDKFDLREHDDKERNYLVWDLTKNERQDNMEAIPDSKVGQLDFPNHVNAHYRYHEKYLEPNKLLLLEG